MLIRHLDFFVTLAEERHFGRAADLCGVTQPALSLALRKLEEDLGVTLILRGQRFMGLTAEGERVLIWGRRILADYGDLRAALDGRRKGGLTGALRLGVLSAAAPLVPALSARFEARNPLARVSISQLAPEAILEGLRGLALEGGLTRAPEEEAEGLVWTPLWREAPLFACRKDHPFASGLAHGWSDAASQPLCATEETARREFAPRKIRAAVVCSGLDGVLAHLREGLWCAVVPEAFRHLLGAEDEILLHPLDEESAAPSLGLLTAAREPPSPMAQALLDCVAALREEWTQAAPSA
ncbi:LysR family transcriptional regulator [Neomegalonema perideroedes]|uniref:LysR family transcriptional regulator n=1 Tax=Neomegalonema perideroedes TaxID=217219 RepID=UPI000381B816|nr:LysR family transcriptional regulator [Neomegalonema perideroedes]